MSARVLLNSSNELRKRDTMRGLLSIRYVCDERGKFSPTER